MKKQPVDSSAIEVFQELLPQLINLLLKEGVLSKSDLKNESELRNKMKEYLVNNRSEMNIIIDHRDYLLKSAEREYRDGYKELAIVLFSTFIEHTINKIIHFECKNSNMHTEMEMHLLKSNIEAKCGWVLEALDLPAISSKYKNTVKTIVSDKRNAYIHYKWKPEQDMVDTASINNVCEDYKKIKELIRYLKNYETRQQFKGNKTKIKNIARIISINRAAN